MGQEAFIQTLPRELAARFASAWTRRRGSHFLLHIVLIALGTTFMLPFFWVAITSLKIPGAVFTYPIEWIPRRPQWSNYPAAFSLVNVSDAAGDTVRGVPLWMYNTFVLVIMGTLGNMFSCTLVAYGLSRIEWRGRNIVLALVIGTMMLPGVVTLVPLFLVFRDLGWLNTYLPLIVPTWMGGSPFYIFLLRQFFSTLPKELDEAATVDGAGNFRILWQILVPLAKPALATVAVFSFLAHYNDFMGPLIYISSLYKYPISVGLRYVAGHYGTRWPLVMVIVMISLVPVITIFFLAQKQFVQGVQLTGLTGR
jgi:multiple sugar transport system permease protein